MRWEYCSVLPWAWGMILPSGDEASVSKDKVKENAVLGHSPAARP